MAVGRKLDRVVKGAGALKLESIRCEGQVFVGQNRRARRVGQQMHRHVRLRPVGVGPQPRVDIPGAHLATVDLGDEELAAHAGSGRGGTGRDIGPGQGRPVGPAINLDGLVATPDQPVVELVALEATVQLFVEGGAQTERDRVGQERISCMG